MIMATHFFDYARRNLNYIVSHKFRLRGTEKISAKMVKLRFKTYK